MQRVFVGCVLAAVAVLPSATLAASAKSARTTSQNDPRTGVLEQRLRELDRELAEIKKTQAQQSIYNSAVLDLKRSSSDQYAEIKKDMAAQNKVALDNGRPTIASRDGNFTWAARSLMQFDAGYFAQGRNPAGVDLNSGTNFRRAQLGFQGTVMKDWAYNFIYDFGGYGVEGRGYIYNAYIEYDGFRPFLFRIGAYTPGEGQEDQTSSGELFFPERAAPVDIARNLAGAPSREAASMFLQGDTYLLSLSYTGKKTGDGTSTGAAVGTFDAQQAVIGRAAWLAYASTEAKWVIEGHLTDVLKPADPTPSGSGPVATGVRLSNGTEVAVDASKTVDTGNIDAKNFREFGFETAGTYDRFYAQGGWFRYEVERRVAVPNPHFTGWYAFAAYSLTGEQHPYDSSTATFRNIRPARPLGSAGGWGAWELAARYSNINLDFLASNTAATGGIAGGKQDVWTLGVNWYPNNTIKFQLDYLNIQANHKNAPSTNISANAVVLRSQVAF